MDNSQRTLDQLMAVIESRRDSNASDSYTSQLFTKGLAKISEKVMEEAGEAVEAAGEPGEEGREHLIYESADLIYHLFVLMASQQVTLTEVESELARRFGISGLEEKASRKK